jgi:hypothetical protein
MVVNLGDPDWHPSPPTEEWKARPIRVAVLDFHYTGPDGRESKDIDPHRIAGTGTAVADLLAEQLGHDPRFQVVRMDYRTVDRKDFNDAVAAGRAPDADAVLLGELLEGKLPPSIKLAKLTRMGTIPSVRLRAALVDAHTGELLLAMEADGCGGERLSRGPRSTTKQTPGDCGAIGTKLDDHDLDALELSGVGLAAQSLLKPLEARAGSNAGISGKVTSFDGATLTVALDAGSSVKPGDQLTIYAAGLTKNLATGTLKDGHGLAAGQMQVTASDGASATGTFTGELRPAVGDAVAPPTAR